ncbi:MAG: xanthine dehydrogenase family protein molybdopterin-binding subunit, partial [Chloroflexi bacterium]|nr:xanthine dehydrogenase family protein molybdopterin-binding subunit [Chloroflexota bacterium]
MAAELIPPRLDALDKVTGRARFIEDLPELPGSAFAAAIRSPYSHARILSIDSSAAQSLPGVLGVLHRDQFGDFPVHPQPRSECQDFVARDLVRFDGDLVGLVAAIDPRIAVEAARLVDVEYELLPPVFSFTEAVATDAPVLHEGAPDNIAVRDTLEWGDVEAGFGKAAHVVEGTFYAPSAFHHPMEPASSFQLHWHGGELEVWAPAHKLFRVREELAELLEIAPEQVRVHTPYIGGSFGGKDETSLALNAAAVLSRSIGRPIRYSAGAEESFRANARHAMTYRGRLGISETGEIVALDVELELDTGAYLTGAEVVTNNAVGSAMGPYRVPNLRVVAQTAYTNKVPAATFRSTGRSQTTFALESLIDDAAAQSGLDPLELRLKNL